MAAYVASSPCQFPLTWNIDESWIFLRTLPTWDSNAYPDDAKGSFTTSFKKFTAQPSQATPSTAKLALASKSNDVAILQKMMDMPLDIIYEIFMHLSPMDLLNISRASRCLRELLMSRQNAGFLWRSAVAGVRGLPLCPANMNEPQYTKLAFEESCHFCSANDVKDVYWACQVRCCSKCIKQQFVTQDELDSWIPEEMCIEEPTSLFPYSIITQHNSKQPTTELYLAPLAQQYLAEVSHLLSTPGEKSIQEWVINKREIQLERIKHASMCEQWHNQWIDPPLPSLLHRIPLFDIAVTLVLALALFYLWKDTLLS